MTTCIKSAVHNLHQVCSSQIASSLQFTNCIKSAVHNLHQVCSSQLASSLQFTTCIKSAVHNLHQVCWQLATDLILSSRSKRCERILISAWWSQVASSLQQTCCNLRVSGCVHVSGGQDPPVYIMIDWFNTLRMREKTVLAFKFGFKFPVGGSIPVLFISIVLTQQHYMFEISFSGSSGAILPLLKCS
jgi:hypothetical protein